VIVVVGSPAARFAGNELRAAGMAADVARAAASGGGAVQIVGRIGDDAAGDAVLLDLAGAGVDHVAVLRAGGETTPLIADDGGDELPAASALADEGPADDRSGDGLALEAADIELALRYLPDYRVIVVAPGLDVAAIATVVAAAGWSEARLVGRVEGRGAPADLPADATVLEQPHDADAAFASVVARYAVELDRGTDPASAFATASAGAGWESVRA
jgi:hypothetical protein